MQRAQDVLVGVRDNASILRLKGKIEWAAKQLRAALALICASFAIERRINIQELLLEEQRRLWSVGKIVQKREALRSWRFSW